MDCLTCPYSVSGDAPLSLDEPAVNAEGEECCRGDVIPSGVDMEEELIHNEELAAVFKRINELMPSAIVIGELRGDGLSDSAISERIGVPRTTFLSQLKKLKNALRDEFPDLIR